jgi:TrmH family RNA methyltransferase
LRPADAPLLHQARAAAAEVIEVTPAVFAKLAYRENPDGWLAIVPSPRQPLEALDLGHNPLLLVAETVEKPGNLGALLRSADAAGVTAVIVCDAATDVNNPNVVRSSRGTRFTVPVVEAGTPETLAWLTSRGVRIAAATPHAALAYTDVNLGGPLAIAVGAEADGLSAAWLDRADLRVRIPMRGKVNSLNVATSAALLLFEAVRQRG